MGRMAHRMAPQLRRDRRRRHRASTERFLPTRTGAGGDSHAQIIIPNRVRAVYSRQIDPHPLTKNK